MNKRGLSSVIGVSLLVLGTIVGASLLWAFVSRNVNDAKSEVIDPDCLTVDLEVISCQAVHTCGYEKGWNYFEADLLLKRNIGKGNVSALRFIFEDPNGISGTEDRSVSSQGLKELGSIRFTQPFEGIPIPVYPGTVKVAALIGPKMDVCPITSKIASCPIISTELPFGAVSNSTFNPGLETFSYNRRADNCCQHPVNTSQCYNGGDPNYQFDSLGHLVNALGQPTGLPPGNLTVCCQYNPITGGAPEYVS
ncbi:MAG: hypothetical protein ACP5N7_05225 [Candidatus Pacearchaeota archaeon]